MAPKEKTMHIEAYLFHGWHVISIEGEFVIRYLGELRSRLSGLEQLDAPNIALDLVGVSYLDSSSITLMVNFNKRISEKKGSFVLIEPRNKEILDVLQIVGIYQTITVMRSIEEFEAHVQAIEIIGGQINKGEG